MVERAGWLDALTYVVLIVGAVVIGLPIVYAVLVASMPAGRESEAIWLIPGGELLANLAQAWSKEHLGRQLLNSFVMAVGITAGKIAISLLSAFAITYFRFPLRMTAFWLIFVTLMLPVEVRIVPTFEVVANAFAPANTIGALFGLELGLDWNLLDSYTGLILPLIASATATFLFRQFFLTVPEELAEAARIDGAGPIRFFLDILLPLSVTSIAALSVILFIFGWNQYLWPLLVTTEPDMTTVVIGVARTLPTEDADAQWNLTMATALLATLPPVAVVLALQRWFVKGLVDAEK
jgi:sn-glycerol 3-phosphate transport system permease protein